MEALDRELLNEGAVLGTVYPKAAYTQERIQRLVQAGYLREVRRPSQHAGLPTPPIGYEITVAGKVVLHAR